MFFRILKNDLKRKKTVNSILILFIILSAIFVSSGINNVFSVLNGSDYYLEKAGIGDYVIITMGEDAVGGIEKAVKDMEEVKECRIETAIFGANGDIRKMDDTICETKNTTLIQALDKTQLVMFDMNNEPVKNVEKGHIYVTSTFLQNNNLTAGDKIKIKCNDIEQTFIIDGKLKDAFLGSIFMGNSRFLMHDDDFNAYLEDDFVKKYKQGEVGYFDLNDEQGFAARVSEIPNVNFDGPKSMMKMLFTIEITIAVLVLILSICLMIVAFVVLKFSINLTITEEFREIGVMKAIGMGNKSVRSLYVIKYLSLSIIGGIIGFFVSIPAGNALLKIAEDNMVLGDGSNYLPNIIGTCIVIIVIPLYAYRCTGKIKKASPIDAIRNGQTGERYKQKNVYRIRKSHLSTNAYMAVNDVISCPRKFITVVVSIFFCTVLTLILVNTTATMKSDKLLGTLAAKADLYITDVANSMKYMGGGNTREDFDNFLTQREQELEELNIPGKMKTEIFYKYKVTFNGNNYSFTCHQGHRINIDEYEYESGTVVPKGKDEILITPIVSEMTGAKIGDVLTIDFGTEQIDCMVTGYFETMNQMGQVIRLHEDAPTSFDYVSTIAQFQITFDDDVDDKEIERRKNIIVDHYKEYKYKDVMNAAEFCNDCIGVADILTMVQYMLLAITLVVVLLVTILMERSFIADEKSQIAILKAIGFKDKDIISWHTLRFGFVGLVAVILAGFGSIPLTKLCITPIFGMMGATNINYNFDFVSTFLVYPGIVLLMTIVITYIVAHYTKKITCRDTSNIE